MAFIVGGLIAAIIAVIVSAIFIKEQNWSPRKKKWAFSFLSSLILCPVFAPVAAIAVIPLPNFVFLMLSINHPLELLLWYVKTWFLILPSFMFFAVLMRGIAAMIYFKKP